MIEQIPHESGSLHVTGEAVYIDDIPQSPQLLTGKVVYSPHAHARILSYDLSAAKTVPGVHAVLCFKDIPGHNDMGPVVKDEPCLAVDEATFVGQAVFLIAAETPSQCREAEKKIVVRYEKLDAVLTIEDAIAKHRLLGPPRTMSRGDADAALRTAPHIITGELRTGAQEHWYLETQTALAVPGERSEMTVYSSTQNPNETQILVAEVLGLRRHDVVVEVRRLGGGFGGKETQGNHAACWAALLARATRRPVIIRLFRDDDMIMTGKRHRFLTRYEAGFDDDGKLIAVKFELNADGGAATDLSFAIMERAMLHADNAYFVPAMHILARVWKTNLPSNTAFRGFGGPQGVAAIETVIDRIARFLKKDAAEIRYKNFYGLDTNNITHYSQTVENNRLTMLWDQLIVSSAYSERRRAVDAFNAANEFRKRGIALTPIKFGISFTTTFLNQAGSLVLLYTDGTVLVNHGGTEMGQGLHTKMQQIAAAEFGIPAAKVKVNATNTSKVPNTSATAASSGSDLNGMAVMNAADIIKRRMAENLAIYFAEKDPAVASRKEDIVFEKDTVYDKSHPERRIGFAEAAALMQLRQVSLSAAGYYRTPDIGWDKIKGIGRPFFYYSFGMAVSEVEVDILTGAVTALRTDLLHDVGESLNPALDLGQVEGAFVQGMGWVTTEEIKWNADGELMTHSPDTYKIPTACDIPREFRTALLQGVSNPGTIRRSKAIGEPPFMLAFSVWFAVKDAISSIDGHTREPEFSLPATNETILLSVEKLKKEMSLHKPEVHA